MVLFTGDCLTEVCPSFVLIYEFRFKKKILCFFFPYFNRPSSIKRASYRTIQQVDIFFSYTNRALSQL